MANTTGLARTTCARKVVTTMKSVKSRCTFNAHIVQHQPMARDTHAGRLGGDRDIGQGAVAPVRQGSRAQGGKGQAVGTDCKREEKRRVGWFCRDSKTETNQPAHSCAADEVPPGRGIGRGHQGARRWTRSPAAAVVQDGQGGDQKQELDIGRVDCEAHRRLQGCKRALHSSALHF